MNKNKTSSFIFNLFWSLDLYLIIDLFVFVFLFFFPLIFNPDSRSEPTSIFWQIGYLLREDVLDVSSDCIEKFNVLKVRLHDQINFQGSFENVLFLLRPLVFQVLMNSSR